MNAPSVCALVLVWGKRNETCPLNAAQGAPCCPWVPKGNWYSGASNFLGHWLCVNCGLRDLKLEPFSSRIGKKALGLGPTVPDSAVESRASVIGFWD